MNEANLRAGEWVEVRSHEEILATLDDRARLDGLPFMPEMFQYCGRRFQVWKRAHKTCDTVNNTGGRWMKDAVHLRELRCDGQAHGGCQASCLLFWKTAWLKPAPSEGVAAHSPDAAGPARMPGTESRTACSAEAVIAATRVPGPQNEADPAYACQATELPRATVLLPWWDVRQYWKDYTSGNAGVKRLLAGMLYASYYNVIQSGLGVGSILRWLYDRFQGVRGGVPF